MRFSSICGDCSRLPHVPIGGPTDSQADGSGTRYLLLEMSLQPSDSKDGCWRSGMYRSTSQTQALTEWLGMQHRQICSN